MERARSIIKLEQFIKGNFPTVVLMEKDCLSFLENIRNMRNMKDSFWAINFKGKENYCLKMARSTKVNSIRVRYKDKELCHSQGSIYIKGDS